jgi:hypothetical protein
LGRASRPFERRGSSTVQDRGALLHCFVSQSGGEAAAVEGGECAVLLRGSFKGRVRTQPEEGADLIGKIATAEQSLVESLKRFTRQDLEQEPDTP